MDDQTQQLIEKLIAYLEAVEGFAVKQAPLLVQDILTWAVVSGVLTVAVWGLVTLFFAFRVKRWVAEGAEWGGAEGIIAFVKMLIFGGLVFFGMIPSLIYGRNALQAWLAPRAYLLDYLRGLLEGF